MAQGHQGSLHRPHPRTALSLTLALLLDALLGEPAWLWRRLPHPVVLMGRLITWLEKRLNQGHNRRLKGTLLLSLLLTTGLVLGYVMALAGPLAELIIAAILLAQKSLIEHVRAVATGLEKGLEPGREAVAMIVGRDPQALDEAGVARAAVESAAENFADGVVAPACWFLILGLPGMVAYKFVNTADSMIGYKSERYREFGWAAARFDDLVNWPAARLAALLIAFAAKQPRLLQQVPKEAAKHSSPNAGWPEAATALALGFGLAGPRFYASGLSDDAIINESGRRALAASDIHQTITLIWRAWTWLIGLVLIVELLAWRAGSSW